VAERLAARLRAKPGFGLLGLVGPDGDPHLAWLDLLWGPRFDREQALLLAARQPQVDGARLLAAGERFDAMARDQQQRLRRLIVRHRILSQRRAAPERTQPPRGAWREAAGLGALAS
jgi:hypothetical protein